MRKSLAAITAIWLSEIVSASSKTHAANTPNTFYLLMAIMTPFVASVIVAAFYNRFKDFSAYIGAFSGLVSFLSVILLHGTKGVVSIPWVPSLNIAFEFYVDGLSLLIATLASGIGVLIFLYSRWYMDHGKWKRKYYAVLTAFMGSMIGLVFSSNMILLFLFWEFTSICSFLLISHNQRTDSGIYASKKSLLITVGSGLLLLIGFILLNSVFGTYSIAELLSEGGAAQLLAKNGLYIPVLLLIGIGAAAKSAQIPLHIWLPNAMEAPTPVSAFLHSATMVKAGVFLIGRFRPILMQGEAWSIFFIFLGLLTMTGAALMALAAEELKELLAYSTASHLGLIVAGFGFSSILGAETASFHILNHAIFKASLFMVAGIVLHETGTQKMSELSGLRHKWPLLAIIATISGLSMAGLPPLNGFYSKELLFEAVYHSASHLGGFAWFLPVIAVTGSIFTFLYSLRFISVFYGRLNVDIHELSRFSALSPAILALLVVLVGVVPNKFIELLINPVLHSVALEAHSMSVHLPSSLKPSFLMSIITIGTGAAVFSKVDYFHRKVHDLISLRFIRSNYYYHSSLRILNNASDYVVDLVETTLLRTYAVWILLISSVLGITGYLISGSLPSLSLSTNLPIIVVLGTSIVGVYTVIKSQRYISSVLTLSILGFMVSIYYLLLDAPDLVMTQLVVETLSLIIFLLVLNKLPEFRKNISVSRKMRDIFIAGFSGLTVFLSVIYATAVKTPGKLAKYYVEHAIPGSGGSNVVNVILVDFRGLDTLGEISVIAMAGLSILMLFKMRGVEE